MKESMQIETMSVLTGGCACWILYRVLFIQWSVYKQILVQEVSFLLEKLT